MNTTIAMKCPHLNNRVILFRHDLGFKILTCEQRHREDCVNTNCHRTRTTGGGFGEQGLGFVIFFFFNFVSNRLVMEHHVTQRVLKR